MQQGQGVVRGRAACEEMVEMEEGVAFAVGGQVRGWDQDGREWQEGEQSAAPLVSEKMAGLEGILNLGLAQ